MIQKNEYEILKELNFAKEAAKKFKKDSNLATYTTEEPSEGCLFAVRWGMDNDCILVLRLAEFVNPVIYTQIIERSQNG